MSVDPLATLVVGDLLPEAEGDICRAYHRYECCRDENHPGQHIAADAEWSVLDVWPQGGAA
ncbi:hypothetical protein M8C13_04355 [Crossiella sp. SN42]|uniref:hypothetical protein n=1 Tax=Crossiella sp. SN42 TaxID=2944808 RepID=UPI00207C4CFC|nr:hypothetical protein [Crossiella sp. SN42]MCO1574990.1 hypothetical protein [Crossiella sp. SN42]